MKKKENLVKESITDNNVISSRGGFQEVKKVNSLDIQRYLLFIDNLRLVGNTLPKDSPEYSEDTFEIQEQWTIVRDKILEGYALEIFNLLKTTKIIELRYGSYKAERIPGKKL